MCVHERRLTRCRECKGGSMCSHGRRRHVCKQCQGAGWCVHGRRKDRCSVCEANAAGLILKLPLQAKPFEVMYLLQKHTEYKPLHKPNGTQDSRIQSRLFHKKVGTFASRLDQASSIQVRHVFQWTTIQLEISMVCTPVQKRANCL